MNYSAASIANVALGRIGARGQLVSLDDATVNAVKVKAAWDFVFQEVLSERDWRFAKTRAPLELSNVTPLYTWRYAWALPADFLRFVRPVRRPERRNSYFWGCGPEGTGWYHRSDPPFWPGVDYKVETLTAGWDTSVSPPVPFAGPFPTGRYALTNYDGRFGPPMITYIQLINDFSQLMPGFVNCLAFRLAQELAITVTEDAKKFEGMAQLYRDALNSAEAQNESMDYSEDEDGSTSWVDAGRYVRFS